MTAHLKDRVTGLNGADYAILATSILMAVGTLFMELGAWSAITDPMVVGKLLISIGGVALAFFREPTVPVPK